MSEDAEWLSEDEAAAWLRLPVEAVRVAVGTGDLPALKLGPYVRISRVAVRDLVLATGVATGKEPLPGSRQSDTPGQVPVPLGLVWVERMAPSTPFQHAWPRKGGGTVDERYHTAWKGAIKLHEVQVSVRIGQHTRDGHERLSVLFGETPICEFVETRDRVGWASVIKPDSHRVLSPGETPPELYLGTTLVPYREATGLKGIGVPAGISVVIRKDELASAVHHAAARRLARKALAVRPAPPK